MSKSIGSNIKTIVKQAINIPLELTSVVVEVAADAANLTSATISGVKPTTQTFGVITGHFLMGAVNSELSEEDLKKKIDKISFDKLRKDVESGSGKAGQSTTRAITEFFSEE